MPRHLVTLTAPGSRPSWTGLKPGEKGIVAELSVIVSRGNILERLVIFLI
jgi:hypothetical protein